MSETLTPHPCVDAKKSLIVVIRNTGGKEWVAIEILKASKSSSGQETAVYSQLAKPDKSVNDATAATLPAQSRLRGPISLSLSLHRSVILALAAIIPAWSLNLWSLVWARFLLAIPSPYSGERGVHRLSAVVAKLLVGLKASYANFGGLSGVAF